MAEQLRFDLPVRTALGRDDFFIAPSNALAVALIDAPENWPGHKLALIGPEGAGKTHLASVWAAQTGGRIVEASALSRMDIPSLTHTPLAVENADRIAGNSACETALFHLHNLMAAEAQPLLFTARQAPPRWGVTLPDLASRLGAVQQAALSAPDDALLSAVMMKLFADRQLRPAPDVIPYLARRMGRSFVDVARMVEQLDAASMAQSRPLTRAFAATVLDKAGPEAS